MNAAVRFMVATSHADSRTAVAPDSTPGRAYLGTAVADIALWAAMFALVPKPAIFLGGSGAYAASGAVLFGALSYGGWPRAWTLYIAAWIAISAIGLLRVPDHVVFALAFPLWLLRPGELSEAFGMTEGQISRIMNSPLFQAELARLEAEADIALTEARRSFKVLAGKSVELISQEMEQLADAESWPERKLKIKTCFDVLDRVKVVPDQPQVNIHQHLHAHVEKMSDNELFRDVMDLTKEGQD